MTTTENNRADALIDERIEDAIYRHIPPKIALENAKALYAMAVELLVASPVEQPVPSPADEQAASFEAWCDRFPEISAVERLRDAWQEARAALPEDRIDWIANTHCPGGTAYPVNVKNAIREALREARISDNETGAEVAQKEAAMLLLQARDELCLIKWEGEDPPERIHTLFDKIEAFVTRSPAMAAEAVVFEITEQAAAEWASRHDVDHVLKHFSTQRNAIEDARTLHLLAASPSSQPAAAAPIENAEEMRDAAMWTVQAMGFVYAPGSERWHPNVNHIPAPSLAEERRASWYCCDPVQICSAQCDSCAKQARAALKAIIDERAECIAWANANGFTKYHESMCAAWEERARRAAQQLSAEIRELKVKLGSYEREREDQIRYLAAQSEEIAGLKQQLAHADARVGLTATVIQKCIDSCAAEYLEDVTGHPEDAAYCQGITDCIDALNCLKSADWSAILAAHSGQSEPETATVARIEQLRKALFESRDAMRVMSNWVKKSDPAGHSWAVRMVDRANAALNGEPEPRAEVMPLKVERHSDMSVLVVFNSCRQASVFEREIAVRIQGVES
ncbi:gp43 [Burkholderia pseudomallei]|nr:gp43 [Burkholderia pseudomallei]